MFPSLLASPTRQKAAPERRGHATRGPDHKETKLLMASTDSMDCERGRAHSNHVQDLRDQGVVLIHVLTLHPAHLRAADLVRELTAGSAEFADLDRFRRAVSDLVGVGLLFESAELVLPTRAALRFNEISGAGL